MAMEYLIEKFEEKGRQDLAREIGAIRSKFGGDIPLPVDGKPNPVTPEVSEKIYPEISLEKEWGRQAQILAGYFAQELNLTSEQYIATLPQFEPQPENWNGRLDTPVIIETRISPERQLDIVGVYEFFDVLKKTAWVQTPGYKILSGPDTAWLDDGRNHMNQASKDVKNSLKEDEVGGKILDGLALFIVNPTILKKRSLDLPDSLVDEKFSVLLALWGNKPVLSYHLVGETVPSFGSVVRGRQK